MNKIRFFFIVGVVFFIGTCFVTETVFSAPSIPDPVGDEISQFIKEKSISITQLGDSYSAGNGAEGYESKPFWCHRNSNNWGSKFVNNLRKEKIAVSYQNLACSGAKIENLFKPQSNYASKENVVRVFSGGGLNKNEANVYISDLCRSRGSPVYVSHSNHKIVKLNPRVNKAGGAKRFYRKYTEIKYKCVEEVPKQAGEYLKNTDIVMLTIGGNDLLFSEIAQNCLVHVDNRFKKDKCLGLIKKVDDILTAKTKDYNGMSFEEHYMNNIENLMKNLGPNTKLIIVGYPHIIGGKSYHSEMNEIIKSVRQLSTLANNLQKQIIGKMKNQYAERIEFISQIADHFEGHAPYLLTSFKASSRNSKSWLHDSLFVGALDSWKVFHPNPIGHEEYAKAVSAYQSLIKKRRVDFKKSAYGYYACH